MTAIQQKSFNLLPVGVVLLALFFGCATTGVNKGDLNLFTTEDELRLGEQFSQEVPKQYPILNDPQVTAYFDRIGQNIAAHSERSNIPYHFQVIDTDDINAFALPGGYIYIHKGLITHADNLSEVAGVIAHEVSHVVGRHGTEQLTRQYGFNVLTQLVLGENPGMIEQIIANLTGTLGILHYGRKAEHEADHLAVRYAYAANYDPMGLLTFFQKLQALSKSEPSKLEVLFSTHPPTSERINRVQAEINQLPSKPSLIKDDPEFQKIKAKLLQRVKS
ncbi:MAG: M48 family metallopeptidase [candidate division KSB1 bacterium]|nr:M48 family metallopeptidase [candidate division KSB1 bacterium]